MNRRDFLGALGTGGFAWGAATEPEVVLWNGNIHTVDAASPHAEAGSDRRRPLPGGRSQ